MNEQSISSRINDRLNGETPNESDSSEIQLTPIYISKEEWAKISVLQDSERQDWKQQHGLEESDVARVDLFSENEEGESVVEAFIVDVNEDFGTILRDESEKLTNLLEQEGKVVGEIADVALSQTVEVSTSSNEAIEQFYRELDGLSTSIYEEGSHGTTQLESSQQTWKKISSEFQEIYRSEKIEANTESRIRILAELVSELGGSMSRARVHVGTALNHSRQLEQSAVDAGQQVEDESDRGLTNEVARQYGNTINQTHYIHNRIIDALTILPSLEDNVRQAARNINDIRSLEDHLSFSVRTLNAISESMELIDSDMDHVCNDFARLRRDVQIELEGKR